jgi:hypothetical protein
MRVGGPLLRGVEHSLTRFGARSGNPSQHHRHQCLGHADMIGDACMVTARCRRGVAPLP